MKIAVVGLWHLGTITSLCLSKLNHKVYGFDNHNVISQFNKLSPPINELGIKELLKKNINKKIFFEYNFKKLKNFDVIWITYDSVINNNDVSNFSHIFKKIKKVLEHAKKKSVIILSSQIPIGSIKKIESYEKKSLKKNISFAYIPENLRLGNGIKIFLNPERIVIGSRNDLKVINKIKKLLNDIKTKKIFVETETAEMTKHAINSFLACSIAFINEIGSIAKKYSISFDDLKKCIQSDKRIGYKSYLKPANAFSGGTLGRDINFLLKECKKNKTNSILLKSILMSNRKHSKWVENLINKKFPSDKNCILQIGLSYTHGTTTLRRSLPYEVFKKLSKSYYIKVYDNYIKSNLDTKSALKNFFLEPKSNNKFNIILAFNKIDKKFHINSFIKKNATIIDVNGENKDNIFLKKIKYISLENG
jgi:UDPglucose 6-dehydrogenase